jgi:hypothetical protein
MIGGRFKNVMHDSRMVIIPGRNKPGLREGYLLGNMWMEASSNELAVAPGVRN